MKGLAKTLCVLFLSVLFVLAQDNLVVNPGFEDGSGEYPDSWSTYVQEGNPSFSWVSDVAHSGAKSVRIVHNENSMSSFYQTISVKANYVYKISGYIKTENVEAGSNWWEGGAQLRVAGDVTGNWWDNMTERVYGTSDWTYVELEVTTTEDASSIEIHCKLGEGMAITGTAWFDDVSVTEERPVGEWFENGDFETGDPANPTFPASWYESSNTDGAGTAVLDETVFHGGSKSLKLIRPSN